MLSNGRQVVRLIECNMYCNSVRMGMNVSTSAGTTYFRVKPGTRAFQNTSRIISTIPGTTASVTTPNDLVTGHKFGQ